MNSGRFARTGSANAPRANSSTVCQKCLQTGHFIYDCKNPRPYKTRPSRSKQLENPKLMGPRDKPSVEVPDEFKSGNSKKPAQIAGTANAILEKKAKEREAHKKSRRSSSPSSSSSSSDSDSDSDSDSGSSSGSSSDSRSRSSSRSRSPSRTPPSRTRSRPHGRHSRSPSPRRRSASPDMDRSRRRGGRAD